MPAAGDNSHLFIEDLEQLPPTLTLEQARKIFEHWSEIHKPYDIQDYRLVYDRVVINHQEIIDLFVQRLDSAVTVYTFVPATLERAYPEKNSFKSGKAYLAPFTFPEFAADFDYGQEALAPVLFGFDPHQLQFAVQPRQLWLSSNSEAGLVEGGEGYKQDYFLFVHRQLPPDAITIRFIREVVFEMFGSHEGFLFEKLSDSEILAVVRVLRQKACPAEFVASLREKYEAGLAETRQFQIELLNEALDTLPFQEMVRQLLSDLAAFDLKLLSQRTRSISELPPMQKLQVETQARAMALKKVFGSELFDLNQASPVDAYNFSTALNAEINRAMADQDTSRIRNGMIQVFQRRAERAFQDLALATV